MMSMGVIFAMIVDSFWVSEWLQNGGCILSEWYRSSFGIVFRQNGACISKLASAKLQHEKADSKFFANLWRFEMLKSAHPPSVYGEKFIFCVAKVYSFPSVTLGKSDTSPQFNDWRPKSPYLYTFGYSQKVTIREKVTQKSDKFVYVKYWKSAR